MDAREYRFPKDRQYKDKIIKPMNEIKDVELEHALSHLLKQEKEKRMVRIAKIYNNWTQEIAR